MSPSLETRENREFAAELKCLVGCPLAEQIRDWARARMSPDPFASGAARDHYRISSLYFDTDCFDVFRRTGSYGRSKYRIRRYGQSEVVFLERKLKTRGMVSKRRSAVNIGEISRLVAGEAENGWPGRWYHQRLLARKLSPVCQIAYGRTARVLMTGNGPIRLTLDDELKAVTVPKLAFNGERDGVPLLTGQIILELKFRGEMPALFKRLTEEFSLNLHPVSKYRLAVTALGLVQEEPAIDVAKGQPDNIVCLTS